MTLNQALAFAIILGTMGLLIWGRIRYDRSPCSRCSPRSSAASSSRTRRSAVSATTSSSSSARPGGQRRNRPIGPRRNPDEAARAPDAHEQHAGGGAGLRGHRAVRVHEEHRCARDLHPDRAAGRASHGEAGVARPDAARVGALLGGIITLIGTSPNIIVSRMREQITGEPFRMFDFAGGRLPGGCRRRFPQRRVAAPAQDQAGHRHAGDPLLDRGLRHGGASARDFAMRRQDRSGVEALGDGDVTVAAIIREGYRRYVPDTGRCSMATFSSSRRRRMRCPGWSTPPSSS